MVDRPYCETFSSLMGLNLNYTRVSILAEKMQKWPPLDEFMNNMPELQDAFGKTNGKVVCENLAESSTYHWTWVGMETIAWNMKPWRTSQSKNGNASSKQNIEMNKSIIKWNDRNNRCIRVGRGVTWSNDNGNKNWLQLNSPQECKSVTRTLEVNEIHCFKWEQRTPNNGYHSNATQAKRVSTNRKSRRENRHEWELVKHEQNIALY